MHVDRVRDARVRAAIALSIAGHLCALMLLAFLAGGSSLFSSSIVDEIPVVALTTIVHRERRPPAQLAAALPVTRATPAPLPPAPTVRPHRVIVTALARRAAPPIARRAVPIANAVFAPATMQRGGPARLALVAAPATATPTPTAEPTATPLPTAAPSASATPAAESNFGGLFSQNYPPALPVPSVLEAIRGRLGGHGRIRIAIDEAGHASEVQFIGAVPDATVAQEIRSRLLSVTYVPADCNGLHCDGTLELSY